MSSVPSYLIEQEEEKHQKAVLYAKLASKAYDLDDWLTVRIGMSFFRGIAEILSQDFRTPQYHKVGGGGNWIDWLGGDDQGLDYSLFEHRTSKNLVVSFRGSEPLSLEDWIENAEQVLGKSEQYKAAVKKAREINSKVDKENKKNGTTVQLAFTGHSLGGGLATAAALATKKEAIVFDAAGISNLSLKELGLEEETNNAFKHITNYNVQGCFVSDWNKKMDDTTLGTVEPLGIISRQRGKIFWLQSISERASFLPKGLLGMLLPGATSDDVEAKAETFLAHAWHVFTYQLEHKNFVGVPQTADEEGPATKKPRLVTPKAKT